MKTFTQKFIGLFVLVFATSFTVNAQENETLEFSYTGSPQEWVVPCGVTEIQVDAYGASGTTASSDYYANYGLGKGGQVEATIAVTPGQVLKIYVGGSSHFTGHESQIVAGWNGGGGANAYNSAHAGGGATDIRLDGDELTDRILVAGGGGGRAERAVDGGHGGGLVADGGGWGYPHDASGAGKGGSQSSGGAGAYYWAGAEFYTSSGGFGYGSNGQCSSGWCGGGGGGGWYGGSGGGSGGGGGGSSYTHPDLVSNVTHNKGVQTGPGKIILSYVLGDVGSCYVDECGVINGDNSLCSDECGVPNGDNSSCTDECGVVNGDNSSCTDECGVVNGNGYYYFYTDNDSDGLGEGDVITTCSDLSQQFCGSLSVSAGGYPSEVSWDIQGSSGTVLSGAAPFSSEVCLDIGEYTVNMIDSYGDGWNGSSLTFNGQSFTFSSGFSSSDLLSITSGNTESSYYVTNGDDLCLNDPENDPDGDGVCSIDEVYGCQDSDACNFNSLATESDESCEYSSCSDECGVPNGDNSSCTDECGVVNGDNSSCTDECGIINGDNSSCLDCDGVPNGENFSCLDECGVINGDNSSCTDECGVINGDNNTCSSTISLQNPIYQVVEGDLPYYCGDLNYDGNVFIRITDENGNRINENSWNGASLEHSYQNGFYNESMSSFSILPGTYNYYVQANGYGDCLSTNPKWSIMLGGDTIVSGESTYALTGSFEVDTSSTMSLPIPVYDVVTSDYYNSYDCGNLDYEGSVYIRITDENGNRINENSWNGASLEHSYQNGFYNESMSSFSILPGTYNYYVNANGYGNCLSANPQWSIMLEGDTIISGESVYGLTGSFVVEGPEIYGCTDSSAFNYNSNANIDDYSCVDRVYGCVDNEAFNYNDTANTDDGSCEAVVFGCTDATAFNYNADANTSDESCVDVVEGCTSSQYLEFSSEANTDDGSCLTLYGCTDVTALNYNSNADLDDGSCEYFVAWGCTDSNALNYNQDATDDDGTCVLCSAASSSLTFTVYGGNIGSYGNDAWFNGDYTSLLSVGDLVYANDGTPYEVSAFEFNLYSNSTTSYDVTKVTFTSWVQGVFAPNSSYNTNVSPCVLGCMDETAFNYNAAANTDDGSCVAVVNGCMDSSMSNYNSEANTDDGSCVSWEELANNLQSELDNVVLEDGVSQEDVDAVQSELDAANEALDAAMANQEDGFSQADVDAAYADGVASVEVPECEEVATQNIPLDLPQGWSMFGYTCLESLDVVGAFSGVSDNIEIVKDEWGLAYLPAWGFSAFSNLEFGEGYQIKMIEGVGGFQFCSTITPEDGITQADLVALAESYEDWIAPVYGCTDTLACNFDLLVNNDDGSCVYAQYGYDCGGDVFFQIGDLHAGGIVFQFNEDGTGLVADLQDLGELDWWDALDAAEGATSQGYDDWYLPSMEELELMYNTIGNGGPEGNIGGFGENQQVYWSSSENIWGVLNVDFNNGFPNSLSTRSILSVRVIRAF